MRHPQPELLFDAHCHVAAGAAGGSAGAGAAAAGRIICGVSPADWDAVAEAARGWPGSGAALGLHPWHVADKAENRAALDRLDGMLSARPDFWAGEIGLDGRRAATAVEQEGVFAEQLRLAARLGRRVNLHCVKAWPAFENILRREYAGRAGGGGFVVHAFAGPEQTLSRLAGMGAYFSLGPPGRRAGGRRRAERTRRLPPDRLLLESDAFLTPGADAAAELGQALAWLAATLAADRAALAAALHENARRLLADA